jgi:putative transposase
VPGVRVADDLVKRAFRPAAPDVLWVADIAYLRTWEGWLYPAAVQDAFSRRIVAGAWPITCAQSSSSTRCRWRCIAAAPGPGLVHHSDQGSQPGPNRSSQQWSVR